MCTLLAESDSYLMICRHRHGTVPVVAVSADNQLRKFVVKYSEFT